MVKLPFTFTKTAVCIVIMFAWVKGVLGGFWAYQRAFTLMIVLKHC